MEQKKRPSLRATQPRKNLEIRTAALFSTFSYSRGFGGNEKNRGRLRIAALPASPTSLFKVTNLHV